ncbi:MAG: DEAD/DEAH box helicase family protein [Pseudomonadota bacterium]
MTAQRHGLARYQQNAVEALTGVVQKVARLHEQNAADRLQVSLKSGVTLLQSPTGSGKTLVLARVLEGLKGSLDRPTVWLWFAPFAGLIAQTREALSEQASGLRLRDISTDREAAGTHDGDVFVQTWAAVVATKKEGKKVRRTSEDVMSLDDLIAEWRSNGFFIGVVIDEAHINFGKDAKAAAAFFLDVLRPDFTLLATATPNDEKLATFEKKAGIEIASRVVVPRGDVVDAGLNKVGLRLGVIKFDAEFAGLVDHETATLTAAWTQHQTVRDRLDERGLALTPLMLVQVEDQEKGAEDPVVRVREKLVEVGVPPEAIREHTSGQPDPEFHTLAYDPDVEVLIFKVAVATGFDAPRAWTLVSVRPNRGKDFGLQIVGRIMRVHPKVRPSHRKDALLDNGYVFLSDPSMQVGLQAAVDEIKAVSESIALITDHFDFVDVVPTEPAQADDPAATFVPAKPKDAEERQTRLDALLAKGIVHTSVKDMSDEVKDAAIQKGESYAFAVERPLFTGLPEAHAPAAKTAAPGFKPYPLRTDLSLPKALWREMAPDPTTINAMIDDIARAFCKRSDAFRFLQRRKTMAHLSFEDLFQQIATEEQGSIDFGVRLSNAKIAERAQAAFEFNDTLDTRSLKKAMVRELRRIVDSEGADATETDLRRAIDLAGMMRPDALRDAIKDANAKNTRLDDGEAIPLQFFGPEGLPPANRSAYGVYPVHRMNGEERAFAELLDQDNTGTVKWWIRNPENETWATRLLLPSGKRFFPDFVVGVSGRTSRDEIALIEIKDDGSTGRLQSDNNLEKIRVQHREYRNVFWSYRDDGTWVRAEYEGSLNRILPRGRFDIGEIVFIT